MGERKNAKGKYPTREDFDAWTAEADAEAVRRVAGSYEVRSIISPDYETEGGGIEPSLFVLAPSGHIYRFPLAVSIRQFDALSRVGNDSVAALKAILKATAPADAEAIESEPVQVVNNIMTAYGQAVERTQGVTPGE